MGHNIRDLRKEWGFKKKGMSVEGAVSSKKRVMYIPDQRTWWVGFGGLRMESEKWQGPQQMGFTPGYIYNQG